LAYKACRGAATDRTTTGSLRTARDLRTQHPLVRRLDSSSKTKRSNELAISGRRMAKMFYEKSKLLSDFNAESGVQSPGQK
jgi:hypothetical protein